MVLTLHQTGGSNGDITVIETVNILMFKEPTID